MLKKRKRHQDADETIIQDGRLLSLPENEAMGNEELVYKSEGGLTTEIITNVQKKIFHATKEMSRALKKARDFEVRKIIKRIKAAKYVFLLIFLTD
jgi:hypothetical protein